MRLWKILVLAPYALIFAWIIYWLSVMTANIAIAIISGMFIAYGIGAAVIYSTVLGIALIARYFIKKLITGKQKK